MSVVVFTGTLSQARKEAAAEAERHGYAVGARLTKTSSFLVCGAKVGAKKMEEAEKLGVQTLTEQQWRAKLATADAGKEEEQASESEAARALPKASAGKRKSRAQSNEAAVVVFTGTLTKQSRKEATAEAEARGFRVQPRLTKTTTFLVYGDKAGQKLKEAQKLGVAVLTEDQWAEKLDAQEEVTSAELHSSTRPSKKRVVAEVSVVGATAEDDEEAEYDEETGALDGLKPNVLLADGTFHDVKSASGSTYVVKRLGRVYSCSCPAWRNQRHPPTSRTCKHLKQLLGDAFETLRARGSATAPRSGGGSSRAVVKTTAPKVLLAKKWEREKDDPVGWWVSEKLDGVRAFWDASKQVFLSRLGNEYPAPSWFTAGFPDAVDLDGELFGGRGAFQFTVGVAKTQGSKDWAKLVYKVFDAPSCKTETFEERMELARGVVAAASSKHIEWVEHTKCTSLAHLDELFAEIEKLGGEGLMVREPGSQYAAGRSSSLLKIKSFHDGEAEVLAHEAGKGKYAGMVGALRCRMASGKMFKVASGLSDQQRARPPAVGSIVVYKCQELTNDGIPRFPVFVGVSADKAEPKDPVIANARASHFDTGF
jgi:DNA ligase-1